MNCAPQRLPRVSVDVRHGRQKDVLLKTNPLGYTSVGQTVVETPTFVRQAEALLSEEERQDLISYLAHNPEAGDVIQGTGGVRKVRFAVGGKGKRGGVRTIYFVADDTMPIYALLVYGKSRKADLTAKEKKTLMALAKAIKAQWRKR
jgi:hypothetical protein